MLRRAGTILIGLMTAFLVFIVSVPIRPREHVSDGQNEVVQHRFLIPVGAALEINHLSAFTTNKYILRREMETLEARMIT